MSGSDGDFGTWICAFLRSWISSQEWRMCNGRSLTAKIMKKSNGKNGVKKPTKYPHEGPSKWRAHLGCYRNLLRLVFANDRELDKAIELLWNDELYDLPHDLPDGKSVVIPADALDHFHRAGLKFTAEKLLSVSDFT